MIALVEVTTKYVTTTDTLAEAWAFVMERVDAVGSRPHIGIRPIRILSPVEAMDGMVGQDQFEVVVEGTIDEAGS